MPYAVSGEKLRLFADDTNLFISSKSITELNDLANIQLNKLNSWLVVNRFHLSIEKTYYKVFSSSNFVYDNEIDIRVGNNKIRKVSSCKYLGIIIDKELKWTLHVQSVYKKNLLNSLEFSVN
jgi:hypothetical protein